MESSLYLARNECFEDGDEFLVFKTGNSRTVIRKEYDTPHLREFLENPGNAEKCISPVLKDSRSTFAGVLKLGGRAFFLKKYNNKGLRYSLRYLFRLPRPLKAFRNAWIFNKCEVPAPAAAAALAFWKNGLLTHGYLLSEFYEDCVPTLEFHKMLHGNDGTLKNDFADTLSLYISRLHENGISHGDLKMSNIFVRETGNGKFSYGIWDLDAARIRKHSLNEQRRAEELARVISSFQEIASRLEIKVEQEKAKALFLIPYSEKSGIRIDEKTLAEKMRKFL